MLVHDSSTNRLFQKCPVMISLSPSPPPPLHFVSNLSILISLLLAQKSMIELPAWK